MAGEINFPTDTAELTSVATNDLVPIYDVSAPGDLKEAQAVNIAKTLIDDISTTATDRTWSVSKSKSYTDGRDSTASTLTNKTINADNNTISNLEVDNFKTGVIDTDLSSVSASDDTIPSAKATKSMGDLKIPLTYIDTDGTLTANSDTKLASQKAVKTYIDTTVGFNLNLTCTSESVTASANTAYSTSTQFIKGGFISSNIYSSGGTSNTVSAKLQYSTNGSLWSDVITYYNGTSTSYKYSHSYYVTPGNYVRLELISTNSSNTSNANIIYQQRI